jgi:hypothetical membrane protein
MRALRILLAIGYAAANVLTGLWLIFLATFPFENQSPDEAATDDWLIGAGIALALCGVFAGAAIALRHRSAAIAYVLAAGAGLGLLLFGLSESHHSDGKLFLWALAVETAGLVALVLSRSPRK